MKKGRLEISQENYIEKLLENFGMKNAKGLFTPVADKQQISRSDCPDEGSQEQKEMNQSRICGEGVGLSLFPSDSLSFESYEQFVRKSKKSKNDCFFLA